MLVAEPEDRVEAFAVAQVLKAVRELRHDQIPNRWL